MLDEFRFRIDLRVPFHDIDLLGHVNNINYLIWCETARCEYLAAVIKDQINGRRGWIMAKQTADYKLPLEFMEQVAVGCRISRIGTKSFEMLYEVWSATREQLAMHSASTIVVFDYERQHSIPFPDDWRETVLAYERVTPEIGPHLSQKVKS